jgi:hypothetical protein
MANPDANAAAVRSADPATRRRALLWILLGALIGSSLIVAFGRYETAVQEWLVAEPAEVPQRLRLTLVVGGAAVVLPLLAVSVYAWLMGTRTIRSGQFPPPDVTVRRDTPVAEGRAAAARGRGLQALAVVLVVAAAALCLLLWRLAGMIDAAV